MLICLMSCYLTFCSRFSNMGFISIFQGRKRQWHRRSNGRSTSALFRLFSHRQVSITLQKRTKVYGSSCLISLVMCFRVRHQFKMVQSKMWSVLEVKERNIRSCSTISLQISSTCCFPQLLWGEIHLLSAAWHSGALWTVLDYSL